MDHLYPKKSLRQNGSQPRNVKDCCLSTKCYGKHYRSFLKQILNTKNDYLWSIMNDINPRVKNPQKKKSNKVNSKSLFLSPL